jgi:hypothetical protein
MMPVRLMLVDPFQHLLKSSHLRRLDIGVLIISHNGEAYSLLVKFPHTKH